MAWVVEDRVQDTTTTEGTGTITVQGNPPAGCRTFSAVLAVDDTFPYTIQHRTENEWEDGIGTYSASNQFTRSPTRSSNANALVSFSAGTKDVALAWISDMPLDGGTF